MKNRKINFIKLGILLFGVSIILWNCVDEQFVENEPETTIQINAKTVSFKDAITQFNARKEKIKLKRTYAKTTKKLLEVTPDWNTLKFNDIAYTDANLTTANTEINREGKYSSQLYFINVNDNLKNVIFTLWKDEVDVNGNIINGRIYFNDLEGKFIDAYRIESGSFTKRFIVKKQIQKASFLPLFLLQYIEPDGNNGGGTGCWNTDNLPEDGVLDEVIVYSHDPNWHFTQSPGLGGSNNYNYQQYVNNATNGFSNNGGSYSLSSEQVTSAAAAILMAAPIEPDEDGNCPDGYIKDGNTCVVEDETYFCDCNCEGSETEFTNDLANNMEPKWGQLANKKEILNEINSIPNLNSLSFENQILALENHFNKNLMYSNSLPIVILNPNDDINKYIFTETAGWLDFHHIFKLFKWTNNKGPVSAFLAGEMGELLQSLKGNYSAYSYEDLPSNNVGVALYIRFGEQLKEGTISWEDAVGKALDEMKWTQPEDAPNIDYIPFLLKDNYPKNFTYQPLLGERLKEYHKYEFCKLKKSQQENIKSVHEKFRR